jgi:hypothetical protein
MGGRSFFTGKRLEAACAVDDDREPFLPVGDDEEVGDQMLMPFGKRHAVTTAGILEKREPTSHIR